MGSFGMADMVTGLALDRQEPAVALVLARRRGGYPDPDRFAAMRPMGSHYLFEPVSLPIHGRPDAYGGFVPSQGDLGAALACRMTGLPDWAAFSDKAFGVRAEGVAIRGDERRARLTRRPAGGAEPAPPQVLGLAMFSRATWDHLLGIGAEWQDRATGTTGMRRILEDALSDLGPGEGETDSRRIMRAIEVTRLATHVDHVLRDGTVVEMPLLGHALERGEGGSLLAGSFRDWLDDLSGYAGTSLQAAGRLPDDMDVFLDLLWEAQAAHQGLQELARPLSASASPQNDDNAPQIGRLALAMAGQAARAMVSVGEQYDDEAQVAALRTLARDLARVQEEVTRQAEALAQAFGVEEANEEEPGFTP